MIIVSGVTNCGTTMLTTVLEHLGVVMSIGTTHAPTLEDPTQNEIQNAIKHVKAEFGYNA